MSKKHNNRGGVALDPDHEEAVSVPTQQLAVMEPRFVPQDSVIDRDDAGSTPRGLLQVGVPISAMPKDAYVQRHIDLKMSDRQGKAAKMMFEALHSQHAKTAAGKHVDTITDAVKWLLDKLADELNLPRP